jgi:hypothetical protein
VFITSVTHDPHHPRWVPDFRLAVVAALSAGASGVALVLLLAPDSFATLGVTFVALAAAIAVEAAPRRMDYVAACALVARARLG